jgi:tRNA dimethylallyltransferase
MEVISSDSRLIFRKMDIGTDKISKEIRDKIPHHQIDIVDPDQTYTAGEWKDDVDKEVDNILSR